MAVPETNTCTKKRAVNETYRGLSSKSLPTLETAILSSTVSNSFDTSTTGSRRSLGCFAGARAIAILSEVFEGDQQT